MLVTSNTSNSALADRLVGARAYLILLANSGLDLAEQIDRNNINSRLAEFEKQANRLYDEARNPNNFQLVDFETNWASGINSLVQNLKTEASSALLLAIARDVQLMNPTKLRADYAELEKKRSELNSQISRGLPKRIRNLETKVDETVDSLEEKKREMDMAIASVGIEKYKSEFGQLAKKHRKVGYGWLIAIIAILLVTAAAPIFIYNYFPLIPDSKGEWLTLDNINRSFLKIVIIFTLLYFVSQCIKNYKANRHLQVVNEHRSLALLTFTTFVDHAGDDKDVKHAVLLEVTKTIFSSNSSGYVPSENDGPDSKLIELLTTFRSK